MSLNYFQGMYNSIIYVCLAICSEMQFGYVTSDKVSLWLYNLFCSPGIYFTDTAIKITYNSLVSTSKHVELLG